MLGLLNDAYGDTRNILYYLNDFIVSHPEMAEEIEEFGLKGVIRKAEELEKAIAESMEKLKEVVYTGN
jgi:tripartite-type tricarboxylate transporter receptor subunit TctC